MDLIRASEAAEILKCRRETVYEQALAGKLKVAAEIKTKHRREFLYDRSYIEEVAKNRRSPAEAVA